MTGSINMLTLWCWHTERIYIIVQCDVLFRTTLYQYDIHIIVSCETVSYTTIYILFIPEVAFCHGRTVFNPCPVICTWYQVHIHIEGKRVSYETTLVQNDVSLHSAFVERCFCMRCSHYSFSSYIHTTDTSAHTKHWPHTMWMSGQRYIMVVRLCTDPAA